MLFVSRSIQKQRQVVRTRNLFCATIVTATELRSKFLSYFESKEHLITPGSSVIPEDDPSLLFVNAGMNQFKKYYLGEVIPEHRRLTTSQLCIRAGGKHNDLDNIGFTPRHQTMFEMLGNFSLGDYGKEEAISMAYEFVCKELQIPNENLRVSVHSQDETSYNLWKKIAHFRDDQIVKRGDKDNLWSMGSKDSPSGFCTEIFYTTNPSSTYDDWLEIWNLVNMHRENDTRWIDTGMGCERMLSVLNHVHSNFDTDIFSPLIQAFHQQYPALPESALHIFADHLRTSVVLASEIFPSSKGRGYVMRKILRRLLKYAYMNRIEEPFLAPFVPLVISMLKEQLPSLPSTEERIKKIITNEEEYFWRAVIEGKKLCTSKIKRMNGVLPMSVLHQFHSDTGLPIDMLITLLEENHIPYDKTAVTTWMEKDVIEGENLSNQPSISLPSLNWTELNDQQQLLSSSLYSLQPVTINTTVLTCFPYEKNQTCVILKDCPFFPTQAGQEGDKGSFRLNNQVIPVINTIKVNNTIGCIIPTTQVIPSATSIECSIDLQHRKQIAVHHSATHLLHSLLYDSSSISSSSSTGKQSLQAGSHISTNSFTFDFYADLLNDEWKSDPVAFIHSLENRMNEFACSDLPIQHDDYSVAAIHALPKHTFCGDIAHISRKDSIIHTVSIGNQSHEFCCGIFYIQVLIQLGQHVLRTGELYPFIITSIQSISAGIKRIEAKAGKAAIESLLQQHQVLKDVLSITQSNEKEIVKKVTSYQKQLQEAQAVNAILMRESLQSIQPTYSVQENTKELCVYEIKKELPKEFTEKLVSQLKKNNNTKSSLILQNNVFTLICQNGLSEKEIENMKNLLFEIGGGGKGGGKKGIIKGSCNKSLINCKEEIENKKWF